MPDDKTKRNSPDNKRIDIHDENEIKDWTRSFRCTRDELINAVEQVGTSTEKVREYLNKRSGGNQW